MCNYQSSSLFDLINNIDFSKLDLYYSLSFLKATKMT